MTTDLLQDTVDGLFDDLCPGDVVREVERTGVLPGALMRAFVDAGLHQVGIPETAGGVGGTPADAAAIIRIAGRHACPLPVVELALTGGWLLGAAGIGLPEGLFTTCVNGDLTVTDGRVSGTGYRVPWLSQVEHVVALADNGTTVVRLPVAALQLTPGKNLAGEPRDSFKALDVVAETGRAPQGAVEELRARAAAGRALLMAGACESALRLTVRHAAERHQFGKPLNAFQAVASHLARIAEETAMAVAASDLVTLALEAQQPEHEAAVAKVVAGESASTVAKLAHQVHGAMGVTYEHDLQLFTRRIWAWRDEHGGEASWARTIGTRLVSAGADGAWDIVAGGAA